MNVFQLFVADVMTVAELEVVIVHTERRTEQISHVGRTTPGKVDMIGESEGGFLVHPFHHRPISAHDSMHVPISGSVFKSYFAESLDGHVECRVGLPLAVFLAGHVGGTYEQYISIGICFLNCLNLTGDDFLGPFNIAGTCAGNQVAAVFHDDQSCVHRFVRFGEKF